MNILIGLVLGYILGMPILLRLVGVLHSKLVIQRQMAKMPKSKAAQADLPSPIWPKMRERVSFSMKDNRPANEKKEEGLSVKKMFWTIWAAGLIAVIAGSYVHYGLIIAGYLTFFAAIVFAIVKANPIIAGRQKLFQKAFEIGRSTLGISPEYASQPQAVVQVLEWREILKPSKMQFTFPTTFNADSSEAFIKQFNQVFGQETTWVPDNDPEKGPGWNFEDGEVRLKEMPPLPQMAPWDEHYVLDPSVAWSFFPIGLGVENGIELTNPKTGEVENVLGFDFSGEQPSLSKKLGTYCSPTITTSPMVLCAGGTGGGKSLCVTTKILAKKVHTKNPD